MYNYEESFIMKKQLDIIFLHNLETSSSNLLSNDLNDYLLLLPHDSVNSMSCKYVT